MDMNNDMKMLEEIYAKAFADSILGLEGINEELQRNLPCKTLTWEEIQNTYPNQYVGLRYTTLDEDGAIKTGIVVCIEDSVGYDFMYWLKISEKIDQLIHTKKR